MRKLISISAVLISIGAILGGGYWLGNTAYEDGISAGINAVVNECAKHDEEPMVVYNGKSGAVMVCQGGHLTEPDLGPKKALPEPPSGTAGEPEHRRSFEDQPPPQNI